MKTPERWSDGDDRYVVIPSHSGYLQGNGIKRTADLIIIARFANDEKIALGNVVNNTPAGPVLYQNRLSKPDQAYIINDIIDRTPDIKHFRSIKTWRDEKGLNPSDVSKVIVRPTDGARGIGLLVMDARKTSFESIARVFLGINTDTNTSAGNINTVIDNFNKHINSLLSVLHGTPQWSSAGDLVPGEGARKFKESLFIQEYVTDIASEYRIIIGADNKPVYLLHRHREQYGTLDDVQLAYGRGHEEGISSSLRSLQESNVPVHIQKEFQLFLNSADFALHSFDLFLTKDGKWGIFEFSHEYGSASVPNDLTFNEIKKYFRKLLT